LAPPPTRGFILLPWPSPSTPPPKNASSASSTAEPSPAHRAASLAHALDLLEEEKAAEDWLDRNIDAINADLDESLAQTARGETYSLEEAEARLAQRHVARAA